MVPWLCIGGPLDGETILLDDAKTFAENVFVQLAPEEFATGFYRPDNATRKFYHDPQAMNRS